MYQAILKEGKAVGLREGRREGEQAGRVDEVRRLIVRGGEKRFGAPNPQTLRLIESIDSLHSLERLFERLFDSSSWRELLSPTLGARRPPSNGRN